MAYLEKTVFNNGNITVSGYSKEGAIIPSVGIDTLVCFPINNLVSSYQVPIQKVSFPLQLDKMIFHFNQGQSDYNQSDYAIELELRLYANILNSSPVSIIKINNSNPICDLPSLMIRPSNVLIAHPLLTPIDKCYLYCKPIDIYEVNNG